VLTDAVTVRLRLPGLVVLGAQEWGSTSRWWRATGMRRRLVRRPNPHELQPGDASRFI
jgi:hypothetical protein